MIQQSHSETIALENGSIHCDVTGNGPPLVLISTLAGIWRGQSIALHDRFTVITYDMRGFGRSISATGLPTNAAHADDLSLLLDSIGYSKASIVGLSHGGLVAQHFAVRHQERLVKLGLVSTLAKPTKSSVLFLNMLYGFLVRNDLEGFWEVLKSFLFASEHAETLLRREGALRRAMFDQYTCASLRSIYGQALRHDLTTVLPGVMCPTLVVGGSEDMLFPSRLTEELATLIPGAQMRLLPAAHVSPLETPQAFNRLIVEFFGD